jgi:hypothetical protein
MKLRFYSRAGALVTMPYAPLVVGQPKKYVGRMLKKIVYQGKEVYAHVASDKPFEIDEDTKIARRLIKLVRRDRSLYPADQYTAKACGVPFEQVKQAADGEWSAAKQSAAKQSAGAKEKKNG